MTNDPRPIRVSSGRVSPFFGRAEDPSARHPGSPRGVTPAIDIYEGPEGLILEADLPGTTESTLRVELEHNVLMLHAEVERILPEGVRPILEESRPADYHRSFILSDEFRRDLIRAELKNGVLRLILPRAERTQARRIEVQSS